MKKWKSLILCFVLCGILGLPVQAERYAYDYIIPDVDIRFLTEEEIEDMDLQVVCYAKNEIYARHGRMFVSKELTEYFEGQLWYYGCISPSEFPVEVLNIYETTNIQLLSDREKELQAGGYVLDQPDYDFLAVYSYIYSMYEEVYNEYYIFPDSDSYYLSYEDVAGMTLQEICYGKNEIYARHGREFVSEELTEYFETKTWYEGEIAPSDFNPNVLNVYETANAQFLSELETVWSAGEGYKLDQEGYNIYAVGISDFYFLEDRLEEDFIFYDSDSRYLTQDELLELSLKEVCYAKNEIYARRGRQFVADELDEYFNTKPWYYGRIEPDEFSPDVFNKYEAANVELLDEYEHFLNPEGYPVEY